jgi:hypothetical protein
MSVFLYECIQIAFCMIFFCVEIRPENGSIQRAADHSLGDVCRRRTSFHGADFVHRFSCYHTKRVDRGRAACARGKTFGMLQGMQTSRASFSKHIYARPMSLGERRQM